MSIRNPHAFTTSTKMSLQLIHAVTTSTEMSMRQNHALAMTVMRHYQAQTVFTTIGLRPVYTLTANIGILPWPANQFSVNHAWRQDNSTFCLVCRVIRSTVLPSTHHAQKDEEKIYNLLKHITIFIYLPSQLVQILVICFFLFHLLFHFLFLCVLAAYLNFCYLFFKFKNLLMLIAYRRMNNNEEARKRDDVYII